ncbi:MAG: HEAT repeat domain-containing protein, partial [Planctomycetota bacterium]
DSVSAAPAPVVKPAPKPTAKPTPSKASPVAKKPSSGSGARVPAAAKPGTKRKVAKNVLRAAAIFGAIGGIALLAQDRKSVSLPKPVVPVDTPIARAEKPATPVVVLEKPAAEKGAPAPSAAPSKAVASKAVEASDEAPAVAAYDKKAAARPKKSLRELSKRSRHHEAIARILLELDPSNMTEDAQLRVAYQLSQLGPPAVPAMREMMEEIEDDADRRVLALGLAGVKDDEGAADAAGEGLALLEDLPVQAKILRQLPETPGSNESIAQAFAVESNAETRMLMLKEYTRRIGMNPDEAGPELPVAVSEFEVDAFLRAAANDKDVAIRRETLRMIEERGAPRDMGVAEELFKSSSDPITRKAALFALSSTGGEAAVPLLAELSQNKDVKARLEAVDAISKARSDKALELMEKICKDDPEVRVKKHAQRLLAKMRDPS